MVFSQVSIEESLRVKKRFYVTDIDEYNGCSEPLNNVVLTTVLSAIPAKGSNSKRLKTGYIVDLARDGGISPCSLILGLLYIKRLSQISPAFFSTLSSRELFLVSMLVSSKFLNDEGETEALTNTDFSTIGCVSRKRLDYLEMAFLKAIDWKLFVSVEEYYQFVTSVEGRVALNQACQRGWFSYTDLCAVWECGNAQDSLSVSKTTAKFACGGALLYLMCVATLFASTPQPASDPALSTISPGNLTLDESSLNLTVFESDTPLGLNTSQTSSPLSTKPPDPFLRDSLGTLSVLWKTRNCVTGEVHTNAANSSLTATGLEGTNSFTSNDLKNDSVFDETVTDHGHCIEPGLLLLLNLTAALTSHEFLTPDNISPSYWLNPLSTVSKSPDEYTWKNNLNPDISNVSTGRISYSNSIFSTNYSHAESNTGHSKELMPDVPQSTASSPDNDSKTIPYKARNDMGPSQHLVDSYEYDFTERNSPHTNEFRSPIIVVEMIPMVTGSPPWDYNFPVRSEKSNFTLIGVLGMLAQGMLAW